MFERDEDIYAGAPMRRLQDDQMRLLAPVLQRCFGTHALLLTTSANGVPPSSPMLGCWATLHLDKSGYLGDLKAAAAGEPMPFIDDAFQLILIRHVLEMVATPAGLLEEVFRMLAPGGVLVITGVHPVSVWSPWFCWRGRSHVRRLQFPLVLRGVLQRGGMEIERIERVGRLWPGRPSAGTVPGNVFGGGYVLIARKRRYSVTRLRLNRVGATVSANGGLSPGTRRGAAL